MLAFFLRAFSRGRYGDGMSSFKAEIRADILHEIGVRFDDQLEGAKAEAHRYEGAKQALWQAVHKVEDHLGHVDRDLRDGKYVDIAQAEGEKRRIQECVGILRNLAVTAEVNQYIARGRVEALEQALKGLKVQHDQERVRAAQLKAAEQVAESDEVPRTQEARLPGTHPGRSIKEQRLAEVAAEEAAKEAVREAIKEAPEKVTEDTSLHSASSTSKRKKKHA